MDTQTAAESTLPRYMAVHARKFLTFGVGSSMYGVEAKRVLGIIGLVPIIEVPTVPDYCRGVIQLGGALVPTIDLRRKF